MALDSNALVLLDVGTLAPLPVDVKKGIIAMGICGLLSFISCGLLFLHISYRLFTSRKSHNNTAHAFNSEQEDITNLALGANWKQVPSHELRTSSSRQASYPHAVEDLRSNKPDSNSFLILIHNLLFADMLQALAFLLNLNWWRADEILVPSGLCGAQAFSVMVGSVSISAFLIAISTNTLLTIVWGLKFSRTTVRSVVAFIWIFSFALAFAGVGVHMRTIAQHDEPFYARSIALCWINHSYIPTFGLWLQNFWIVLAIAVTVVCYAWILVALLRTKQSLRHMPPSTRKSVSGSTSTGPHAPHGPRAQLSGHHPAFLIYPAIYIVTTAPLTLVGLLSVSGNVSVSTRYFSLVSVISSLAGLLDAILWSTTILLSSAKDLKDVGLDTYEFIRTPSRVYGNIVWVEGAVRKKQPERRGSKSKRKWWGLHGVASANGSVLGADRHNFGEVDNADGIYMNTITSVQVEHKKESTPSANSSPSQVPNAYHHPT